MMVTIFVGVTAAFLAWRERPEPGATSLAALLVGQCWWSVFFIFEIQATTLAGKVLWSNVQWVGVVVIPVAWLSFALSYTGQDRYLTRRSIAALSVIPVSTVLFAATTDAHSVLYLESTLVAERGFPVLERTPGVWFWVITGYTYLLGFLGSIPLLRLVRSDALAFRGQSVALLIGTLAPWTSNVLFLAGATPLPGLDPTPIAFAVSGVAYLGALSRFRLLGTSPSPNHRARRLVFERMHERAVVVDRHDYVVDLNESAAETLGYAPREALGLPVSTVVPEYETLPTDGSMSGYLTLPDDDGDPYDVTVTEVTDSRGRTIGRVVTFHDVSDYLRRQQRLEVLNRALRHNIRNETNLIYGYADLLGERATDEAAIIKERALAIDDMGQKARTIIDVFEHARNPVDHVPLRVLLRESVSSVRSTFPAVTVDCGPIPADVYVSAGLDPVFDNVVENAAEHNTDPDPRVWIDVHVDDGDGDGDRDGDDVGGDGGSVRVVVSDNGPTIDAYERSVLERGTETPLEHGSGLGLWLITWGTQIAGGQVTFAENEPTGSVVTIEVPMLDPPARSWEHDGRAQDDEAGHGDDGDEETADGRGTESAKNA
ncbi:histidine kinase N-terminal 7TM domain-containing protein [Salinigranum salinum]|uniref:histidine kinase N-terminal 7TM domain-containing protein n=1 Tax=Salinigranum salinum TaxID=1364937 RepID=UPI0018653DD5|nr:histidine kinase N-terminal 7TM domain-containing protein [Salinigranum salinum]